RSRVVGPPSRELIERLSWHFDEPFGDSSAVPTWEVSSLARERVKVALSGDGGDELFGGYRRHAMEKWEHALRRCGQVASRALSQVAAALPGRFRGRNALTRLGGPPDQACAVKFQFGSDAPQLKARIYAAGFREQIATTDPLAPFKQAYVRAGQVDPLNRILYVDLKTYLADDILVKVDRMSMAHGLEVRAPFLDHRLVEMVARLAGRTKVPGPATKPLRRADSGDPGRPGRPGRHAGRRVAKGRLGAGLHSDQPRLSQKAPVAPPSPLCADTAERGAVPHATRCSAPGRRRARVLGVVLV